MTYGYFQKIKSPLQDKNFKILMGSKKNVKAIPQQFQKCFQQWQHCWAKCRAAQGEYFEGNP
jgi:hypothetical protein